MMNSEQVAPRNVELTERTGSPLRSKCPQRFLERQSMRPACFLDRCRNTVA